MHPEPARAEELTAGELHITAAPAAVVVGSAAVTLLVVDEVIGDTILVIVVHKYAVRLPRHLSALKTDVGPLRSGEIAVAAAA